MYTQREINKIIRKYKKRNIDGLNTAEKLEVLKMMGESLGITNIDTFVRDDNGIMSARRMTLSAYLSHLQEKKGSLTVKELLEQLQTNEY